MLLPAAAIAAWRLQVVKEGGGGEGGSVRERGAGGGKTTSPLRASLSDYTCVTTATTNNLSCTYQSASNILVLKYTYVWVYFLFI